MGGEEREGVARVGSVRRCKRGGENKMKGDRRRGDAGFPAERLLFSEDEKPRGEDSPLSIMTSRKPCTSNLLLSQHLQTSDHAY